MFRLKLVFHDCRILYVTNWRTILKLKMNTIYYNNNYLKSAFQTKQPHVISDFRREVEDNCALLDYYAATSGNSLLTFRDNISVPSSRIKNSKRS